MKPGLFAQDHNNSSRDYTDPANWGKNLFNSSFPASLIAYMSSKGIKPVYIKTNKQNEIVHDHIPATDVYRIDPLSENSTKAALRLSTNSIPEGNARLSI